MTKEEKRLYQNETMKRWRLNNPDRVKELNKKYRSTPRAKEKHRIKMAEWRKGNPEKALEITRKNYKLHGTKHNEKRRTKYKTDEAYRAKKLNADKEYRDSGRRKELYHNNPDKENILKEKWKKIKFDDVKNGKRKEYNRKYKDEVWIKKEKDDRDNLTDSYILKIIKIQQKYQIKTAEIPKDLIEAKRNILKLKRITKTEKL